MAWLAQTSNDRTAKKRLSLLIGSSVVCGQKIELLTSLDRNNGMEFAW